ncbi:hypothetical protein SYNPS1DRAFT_6217, partial [Syncephalis pseudoplumigaleata]
SVYHRLKPAMVRAIALRKSTVVARVSTLKHEYRALWKRWQRHVEKLDRLHNNGSGGGLREETPGLAGVADGGDEYSFVTGRHYSRRTFHNPDAARSEAEFLEILQLLQTAEERDPENRAQRTAALISDMILDPVGDDYASTMCYRNRNGLVENPPLYYHCTSPPGASKPLDVDHWTGEEEALFKEAYLQHPKQFGRI